MPSLKETKTRIKSVQNTEKITKAMKMVAASKLRKAQEAALTPRAFMDKLEDMIFAIAGKMDEESVAISPLLEDRPVKKNIEILAISSDRGLCGALNSNVIRYVSKFFIDNEDKYENIYISTIGKKCTESFLRLGFSIRKTYVPKAYSFSFAESRDMSLEFCDRFALGEIDSCLLVFNKFKSAIVQDMSTEQILPIQREKKDTLQKLDYTYEPSKEELLSLLVPRYFATKLYQATLESYASEQGARMTAMDNATRNAKEMTARLTLQYNRARQAAITKELMEIIGGAEAL